MPGTAPRYSASTADFSTLAATAREGLETAFDVKRDDLLAVIKALRDDFGYQQLMEIAGVDFPDRPERFEVVYCLLSLTHNHRVRVHVATDETTPVPSVTGLWPVAGWLEREVFDMYGVTFAGNADLRRILTDYGFEGYPQRKDFPLTGYVELRYSEAEKRVVYEPVKLAQDFRSFDFLMPWEGPEYKLPGDEKAAGQGASPAPGEVPSAGNSVSATPPGAAKTTAKPSDTSVGTPTDEQAVAGVAKSVPAQDEREVSKASGEPAAKPRRSAKKAVGGDDAP